MTSSGKPKTTRSKRPGLEQLLQKQLDAFDDESRPMLQSQHERLQSCLAFLENPVPTGLSEAQRFGRLRARKLLFDILRHLGEVPFLLCATAISITRLARLSDETVLEVRGWWKTVKRCPNGLLIKAKEICNDEFRQKYTAGEALLNPRRKYSLIQITDMPRQTPPSTQPPPTIVDIEFTELLNFFQKYELDSPKLKLICPLFGSPLPWIDINLDSSERTAHIELSLRASEALVKHIRVARDLSGVTEVPN
ncbi:hypothetical protein N7478_010210 [Penicillium angulare]|uniref:uncharacterized protein n=1 Tax=Penicillium angulare TaxID=116970 RepID=UPI00253FD077|nr:uncharacterized protein N7478_010210 [Penicillium angulare]KAJ5267402.1 hypothetical protein N7478_010210 [Penicillium angulare]